MTRIALLVLALSACGGGKKAADKPAPPKPDTTDTVAKNEPAPPPKKEEPPPPPPPKMFHAKATLDPVKGAKQKSGTIAFTEEEGKSTAASGSFDALKAGKYHVVVHDGTACGKNGASAGKAGAVDLAFEVKKGAAAGMVDQASVEGARLEGDGAVIGKVLALHDDAKGKPGKIIACGVVSKASEDEDDAAKKE